VDNYVGEKLGNYRLTRLLGVGGYAAVYLAEHIYLKTQAAIKVLRVSLDEAALARFLTEARTIAHLDHPNIVRTLEFGVQGSIAYLVMSYAPNGTVLRRYPRGSIVPLHVVVQYVRQLADALQYAHAHGVIHRDVKPENILLGRDEEILLGDFGLAVMSVSSPSWRPMDKAGTIGYMAPEQIEGKPGKSSDQYGLAVVVYEWLCGSLPFTGLDKEVVTRHLQAPPQPLSERAPSVPSAIEQVVMKALSKDPSERFLSVLHFAQALEEAYQPYKLVQLLPSDANVPGADAGDTSLKPDMPGIAEIEASTGSQSSSVLDDKHDDKITRSSPNILVRQTTPEPSGPTPLRISKRLILAGLAGLVAASIVSAGVIWSLHDLGLSPSPSHGASNIVQPSRAYQANSGMKNLPVPGVSALPSMPDNPHPTPTQHVGSTTNSTSAYTAMPTPQATPTANTTSSTTSAYSYTVNSASTPAPAPTPTPIPASTTSDVPTPTDTPVAISTPQVQITTSGNRGKHLGQQNGNDQGQNDQ
jgi:serine/threonine protein kinase